MIFLQKIYIKANERENLRQDFMKNVIIVIPIICVFIFISGCREDSNLSGQAISSPSVCEANGGTCILSSESCCTLQGYYSSPDSCKEGKCCMPATCTDTDNGIDYTLKGTSKGNFNCASTQAGSITDSCSDGVLTEYYCSNGFVVSQEIGCENGCVDGACASNS